MTDSQAFRPPTHKIGFWHATALVAGNMIGSGIFLLPASLAIYGQFSLIGWLISSVGAILLAITFARLSLWKPLAGGPYAYTREAFGPFAGFMVAWGYWISICVGNVAIASAAVSNLSVFITPLNSHNGLALTACLIIIWSITFLNIRGVKEAANFQLMTLVLRLVPILLIGTVGYLYFDRTNLEVSLAPNQNIWQVALQTAALTLWSFLGLESATIPANHLDNPTKNIPRATLTGTLLSAIIFISTCTAVMGMIPKEVMVSTHSPFAYASSQVWGSTGYYLIAFAATVSCIGALNGWVLLQGQVPQAIAQNRLFPAIFARINAAGSPAHGLIISSLLVTLLAIISYSQSLQRLFDQMILLATLAVLIPYLFSAMAEIFIRYKHGKSISIKLWLLTIGSLVFSLAAIVGTGWSSIAYGSFLYLLGIPFYLWTLKNKKP